MMIKKIKLILINFFFLFLFILLGLIILELILENDNQNDFLISDKTNGWDTKDKIELVGSRSVNRPIIFIGDSFTQNSMWTFETINQLNLNKIKVSGISLGVSGYGTIQSLEKLKSNYKSLKPKLIVLLFYAWNDIRDNFNMPGIYYSPLMQDRPYFDDKKIIYPNINENWITNLTIYKKVFCKIKFYLEKMVVNYFGVNFFSKEKIIINTNYSSQNSWIPFYQTNQKESNYVKFAWKKTEQAIKNLQKLTNQNNSELLIVGIDNAFTVDDDVSKKWTKSINNYDPELPLMKLKLICKEFDINFLNTLPDLKKLKNKINKKVYNGPIGNLSGHLEPEGEKLIGKIVAKKIRQLDLFN